MTKRRNKGEGSFYHDKSRNLWVSQITLGYDPGTGKQKRKTLYAKTKSELTEKVQEYRRESYGLRIDSDSITFGEFFYKWLYGIKKQDLKTKSFIKYEGLYQNYISKADFADTKLKDLTYSDLKLWYNTLQLEGSSIVSVKYINDLVKAALIVAEKDRLILTNPAKDIRFKNTEKKNVIKVFSAAEQKKLIDYLYESSEPLKYLFLFDLATGLRLGEILALEKSDIRDGKVYVSKNLERVKIDGKYVDRISSPKTESSNRSVPIPEKIQEFIPELIAANDSDLLFPGTKSRFIFNKTPARHLHRICDKLEISDITFHGLRHSYATRLFELGVQIKTVQKLMGHADIETTMNIYTHVMGDVIEDASQKLNTLF